MLNNNISKFIIDRCGLEYLYVEKIKSFDGIIFVVSNGNTVCSYYPDTFYATYGNDLKLSISSAIDKIEKDLFISSIKNDKVRQIYRCLNSVKTKVNDKNYKNPNLKRDKSYLLHALSLYNEMLPQINYMDDDIYENDYLKLESFYEKMSPTYKSKDFVSSYLNNLSNSYSGVRVRRDNEQEVL